MKHKGLNNLPLTIPHSPSFLPYPTSPPLLLNSTQLHSSLLKHGSRMAKTDTVNKNK